MWFPMEVVFPICLMSLGQNLFNLEGRSVIRRQMSEYFSTAQLPMVSSRVSCDRAMKSRNLAHFLLMTSGIFFKTVMFFIPDECVDFRVVKGQSHCVTRQTSE